MEDELGERIYLKDLTNSLLFSLRDSPLFSLWYSLRVSLYGSLSGSLINGLRVGLRNNLDERNHRENRSSSSNPETD